MARSSRGPGHRPLKAEIKGSNPLRATNSRHEKGPRIIPGAFFLSFANLIWLDARNKRGLHRQVKLCCCGLLDTGKAMGIQIEVYGDAGMAKAFRNGFWIYSLLQI